MYTHREKVRERWCSDWLSARLYVLHVHTSRDYPNLQRQVPLAPGVLNATASRAAYTRVRPEARRTDSTRYARLSVTQRTRSNAYAAAAPRVAFTDCVRQPAQSRPQPSHNRWFQVDVTRRRSCTHFDRHDSLLKVDSTRHDRCAFLVREMPCSIVRVER